MSLPGRLLPTSMERIEWETIYLPTSLIALNAETGKRIWHFQFVHHDIWDRDPPSAPALVTVKRNGHDVDAVAQTTKQGYVFLFDRETGKPLFPIKSAEISGLRS